MLRVETSIQYARLELTTKVPDVQLDIPKPVIDLNVDPPAVTVEINQPQVHLELAGLYEELGIKRSMTLSRQWADAGRQTALERIAHLAAQGDRLAAIEKGGDIVKEVTAEVKPRDVQLQFDIAPKSMVPVDVTGGVNVHGNRGEVMIGYQPQPVRAQADWGEVTMRLAQKASIEFHVVGDRFSVLG